MYLLHKFLQIKCISHTSTNLSEGVSTYTSLCPLLLMESKDDLAMSYDEHAHAKMEQYDLVKVPACLY